MGYISLRDGEKARLNITKAQEDEISKLYRQVYLDLKKKMNKLSHSGTTSESLRKTYLNKLTKELKAAYKSLGVGLEKTIEKGIGDAATAVVQNNADWLKKAGLTIEGAYSYVPKDIVSMLVTGQLYGEGWTLSKAIWGQSQKHAEDINKIVAAGVAANKSAYDIAKDLEQYVNPEARKEWDWSKVYPGTSKKVDYNAQRLARTMVSHAYQQSLLATTKYNPFVTGYKWRSAHTHRTCELCNSRDGKIFSAEELPLDHPNGLCTFLVELEGSLEDVANRLGDWANGAEDPDLDKWASSMFPKSSGQFQLTPTQSEWLGKAGFSVEHMPQNFKEFANGLSFEQQSKLLELAGSNWGDPHPYQAMEKWYKKSILVGPFSHSGKYSPKTAVKEAVKETTKKTAKKAATSTSTQVTPSLINKLLGSQTTDVFEQEAKGWWDRLSETQRSGIRSYTGASYRWMNTSLREGTVNSLTTKRQETLKATQQALLKYSSSQDMVVRRGSSVHSLYSMCGVKGGYDDYWLSQNSKSLIGTVAQDDGFLSTSPVSDGGFTSREVEYRIFVPQGSPAPYVDRYSQHRGEKETILPAGSLSRVLDVEKSSDGWVVYLEFLGIKK